VSTRGAAPDPNRFVSCYCCSQARERDNEQSREQRVGDFIARPLGKRFLAKVRIAGPVAMRR